MTLQEAYRETGVIPPALEREPIFSDELQFYLDAFFLLSDFRRSGFSGPDPIDFASILRYAEWVGYNSTQDQAFFVNVIRECDRVYRKFLHEKSESGRKRKPVTAARKPSPKR